MPLASRPNLALKSKQDINPSIDRNTEATAQDFADYNAILEDHANLIDDLSKAYAAATFYGIRGSLALFQAEFPDAVEGYGVIDPGNGNPQIIAQVTNGVWTATTNVAPIQRFNTKLDRPQPGIEDVIYVVKDEKILSLWYDGSYKDFGKDGYNGKSTYQIALDFGFVGTEPQWLVSLVGIDGKSAYEVAVDEGFVGTQADWVVSLGGDIGPEGKSNYQLWLDAGNVGTFQEYQYTLKGEPGPAGEVTAAQLATAKQEAIDAAKVYTDSVIASSNAWQNKYNTISLLLAGQANQTINRFQYVNDATTDTTVNSGWATYELLGAKTGVLADYRKLSEQESLDVVANTYSGFKVYNVETYGAVHNGVTDDTVSIQTAINAAFAAGGGRVYFPQGIYIIGGDLQTSIDGINYNSQIYIPQTNFDDLNRTSIELSGEFQPNLLRSLGISTTLDPNSGVVLRSTIQGSGVEPCVIKNKGAAANYTGISYTSFKAKNISIQITPNGSNKITMGGIDCYHSVIANFEYVTCYPFNINLVNSAIPDVIAVTGISMPKVGTEHINTLSKCTVGGFTKGYIIGEHTSVYDVIAICCVDGFYISPNNHMPVIVKGSTFWCINQITVHPTASGIQKGFFLCQYLAVEWRSAGSWYDTVSIVKDTGNLGFGKVVFDIVEANQTVNNEKFKKIGGINLRCEPISVDISSQIPAASYTLKYIDAFKKNKLNSASDQTVTIPPNSSVSYDIDAEIVIQRLGVGNVEITTGVGVTLNTPAGYSAKIKSQYDAVSLVQTAVNVWSIYGALTTTP